jgi:3-methyladenine DNA glycosylase AlkD
MANPQQVENDKFYHKYTGYQAYGLNMLSLRGIIKKHKKLIKEFSCDEVLKLAVKLYGSDIQEQILVANSVLAQRLKCVKSLSLIDDIAGNHLHTWSATDDFCSYVLQPLLLREPEKVLRMLRKWNKSQNMWKRRASVVAFTRKVGESGKFTKEALLLCENLIWDKEDLIQKAVGWALKDVMRGDKERVVTYVKKLRRHGVSTVITLYAIRDLKGARRQDILRIKA